VQVALVGIGTDSPATKLQVNFGDAGGNLVNLVGDGATAGTAIATNWILETLILIFGWAAQLIPTL
jgi:hypothetical protein